MEAKVTRLGGSLPVPSVQELAKQPLKTLPPRYVRNDLHPPFTSSSDTSSLPHQIPIIDMNNMFNSDDDEFKDSELQKFHNACKDWGFFQLINHGVSEDLVEKVRIEVQEFFKIPLEEKKKYGQRPGDLEGFGQAFVVSEDQKLDWADMFYVVTLPNHLRKPHLLPNLPLPLRDTLENYSSELKNLAMKILDLIAKALKMEPNDMKVMFEDGLQGMRMNYYPPCPHPELAMGLTPHSDSVGITILLQLNEMEGLQIKKDGIWVSVKPLPNAFVVNIGDILEIITNGAYQSIEHRATVNSVKERLSIAAFHNPNLEGEMGPAPSLVSPENPALFRRVGVADYFKGYFSRELSGKSYLDVMRITKRR